MSLPAYTGSYMSLHQEYIREKIKKIEGVKSCKYTTQSKSKATVSSGEYITVKVFFDKAKHEFILDAKNCATQGKLESIFNTEMLSRFLENKIQTGSITPIYKYKITEFNQKILSIDVEGLTKNPRIDFDLPQNMKSSLNQSVFNFETNELNLTKIAERIGLFAGVQQSKLAPNKEGTIGKIKVPELLILDL